MKKRIFSIAAVLLFVLSLSAQAVSIQSIQKNPSLTFEGKTAVCYAVVTSGNSSDAITVHISLWCGDSLMGSWSGSGSIATLVIILASIRIFIIMFMMITQKMNRVIGYRLIPELHMNMRFFPGKKCIIFG